MDMATTLVSVEEYLNSSYPDGDREYVDGRLVELDGGDLDHSDVQTSILYYLRAHYRNLLWAGAAARVQVSQRRFRVPDVAAVRGTKPKGRVITEPPFLVVEIVSPDDKADELDEKVDDYLRMGIPNIWVVNPRSRRIWVRTAEGARAVKDPVVSTQDPVIEIPLAEIFTD
jgi:Uma2 family endonuclease